MIWVATRGRRATWLGTAPRPRSARTTAARPSSPSRPAPPSSAAARGSTAGTAGRAATTPTNLLDGATDGGPDENDDFADERNNYEQTEAGGHHLQQRAVMTEDRLGVGVDQRLCILHFGINRA
jgi:hypothetical protein